MRIEVAEVGRLRSDADGGRRYRVVEMSFDTRAVLLENLDDADTRAWEPSVLAQHMENQRNILEGLLAEYGRVDGQRKIEDFRALGAAPFSIVAEHNTLLGQVRQAFTAGAYYPALVGAAALGERIINELILTLRADYAAHKKTSRRIRTNSAFPDWNHPLDVLEAWTVITAKTRKLLTELEEIRHASVHYTSPVASAARSVALGAIVLVQEIVSDIFGTLWREGVTIDGTTGVVMIRRDAEQIPLIRHFLLPRAVLVSPRHAPIIDHLSGSFVWTMHDDGDYPTDDITDHEYAARLPTEMGEMAAAIGP